MLNESGINQDLISKIPSQALPQLQNLLRMVSLGASPKMVAAYLGITQKEYDSLELKHPELFREIWRARTSSAMEVTANLYRIATTGDDVGAIKTMLGLLTDEYKDKPPVTAGSVNQTNIHLTLPSTKEALKYIQNDPSIIEGDTINE